MSPRDKTQILSREILARGFATLERVVFRRRRSDGAMSEMTREILDTGDGAAILPYDPARGTIILIRQFRGVDVPEGRKAPGLDRGLRRQARRRRRALSRVIAETEEETGIKPVGAEPRRLFEAYMSRRAVSPNG